MTEKNSQAKIVNLSDVISPHDLAKIEKTQASTDGAFPVDNEWMILTEWLKLAGYQAYLDARDDARDEDGKLIVTMEEILTLIVCNRKLESINHYKNAEASFIGSGSAQAQKPSQTFKQLTKNIIKSAEVQE